MPASDLTAVLCGGPHDGEVVHLERHGIFSPPPVLKVHHGGGRRFFAVVAVDVDLDGVDEDVVHGASYAAWAIVATRRRPFCGTRAERRRAWRRSWRSGAW